MVTEPADNSGRNPGEGDGSALELETKVRFLSDPSSYPHDADRMAIKETHMSWVFLVGSHVYKLKKPVRYPYLDFTTLEARERFCLEEVRLNSRLAPGIYRGVIPLVMSTSGRLSLGGEGVVTDWLVEMQRLPEECMLDMRLKAGRIREHDVERLAQVLASFYRDAEHPPVDPEKLFQHFQAEIADNRAVLLHSGLLSDPNRNSLILDRVEEALVRVGDTFRARVVSGHIVDGHGDLRPEHVCLSHPIVIFDCLEFNRDLRRVDPFDELAFLDVECTRLGFSWFGRMLIGRVADLMGDAIPGDLLAVYRALHATLRARLSLAHLLDPVPREPRKWAPLAQQYLALAENALNASI